MKTKENPTPSHVPFDRSTQESKPKSLRPARSMVAVRSLKPKATVANINLLKSHEAISVRD